MRFLKSQKSIEQRHCASEDTGSLDTVLSYANDTRQNDRHVKTIGHNYGVLEERLASALPPINHALRRELIFPRQRRAVETSSSSTRTRTMCRGYRLRTPGSGWLRVSVNVKRVLRTAFRKRRNSILRSTNRLPRSNEPRELAKGLPFSSSEIPF